MTDSAHQETGKKLKLYVEVPEDDGMWVIAESYRLARPSEIIEALDFPSDEDVEVAARVLAGEKVPLHHGIPDPGLETRRQARAALQAVAVARRTEET